MDHVPQYAPLSKAVRSGDLEATRKFIDEHPKAKNARISFGGKTALHVAALFGHLQIVEELAKLMSAEDVEMRDFNQKLTALQEATYGRKIEVAKCLVEKNKKLLTIPNVTGFIPLTRALDLGNEEMARYLYSVTPLQELTPEKGNHGATVLNLCYYSQMLDMALDLLRRCPSLAVTQDLRKGTFLQALASRPSAFPSGCHLSFWETWIYNRIHVQIEPNSANGHISINMPETSTSQSHNTTESAGRKSSIYQIKLGHMQALELLSISCHELSKLNDDQLETSLVHDALNQAAMKGTPEFLIEVIKVHVHLFWRSEGYRNRLFIAVEFRQARVFRLLHGMIWKDVIGNEIDRDGNTLLHMAGLLAPYTGLRHISGAALQMQRELQWFKEVESIMPALRKESLNNDMLTARELFTENHKELVKQGEKWMKDTAGSCSVVAALVATIVFAVAFAVPGGNNQTTGYPIFSEKKIFILFIISDAISLFSSSTSILMFLGILTSRYAEEDFLKALPTKLIIGLSTLFISLATMLIAFCAALFSMIPGKTWVSVPVILLASVPVTLFILLQFPLLREITMSTYGPSIFDRNVEQWLS